MLVLTRKTEQKIIIGNNKKITVTVLKVQGDQVSLGIEADPDVPVYRQELLAQIQELNVQGAVSQDDVDVKTLAQNLNLNPKKGAFAKKGGKAFRRPFHSNTNSGAGG